MPRIRKSYAPSLKAKVAVEAIKGNKTATQIAPTFSVHPNLVMCWKKQALEQLPELFANGHAKQQADTEKDELFQQIGRLKVELDFLKKKRACSTEDKRGWINPEHADLSIRQQCELLGLPSSTYYYQPRPETPENLRLLRKLDELYLDYPFFGSRRMAVTLQVNRKRMQRLMRILGLEALYPKPPLSRPAVGHEIYPYLLRGVEILKPNHVWSTDITYIPMRGGFLYLVAVMDWFSRFVLSWELSNTMETGFCLAALDAAFAWGKPEVFNSDQGSQFTSNDFTAALKKRQVQISMDGRGRCLDNVFIERLRRSLKYEMIYTGDFVNGGDLWSALDRYFEFYNYRRPHQALGYQSPIDLYRPKRERKEPIAY